MGASTLAHAHAHAHAHSHSSGRRSRMVAKHLCADSDDERFMRRINKSLYYNQLPELSRLSLPLSELASEAFSETQKGRSFRRLHIEEAAEFSRNACVSPCSLVLALLYLERLKAENPEYAGRIAPSELFFVSLMVSNKFLQDSGEDDDVIPSEWAASAGVSTESLIESEREFLSAIDWRVFVSRNDFLKRLAELESEVALKQAKSRGWFTYGDLSNVILVVEIVRMLRCLVTVYLALSIGYAAGVGTLLASSSVARRTAVALAGSCDPGDGVVSVVDRSAAGDVEDALANILLRDVDLNSELNFSTRYVELDRHANPSLANRRSFLDSFLMYGMKEWSYFYYRDENFNSNYDFDDHGEIASPDRRCLLTNIGCPFRYRAFSIDLLSSR